MFAAVFGPPVLAMHFGAHVAQACIASAAGSCEILAAETLENVKALHATTNPGYFLIFSHLLDRELTSYILASRTPVILFLSPVQRTMEALMHERGMTALEAVRASSHCLSALEPFAQSQQAILVEHQSGRTSLESVITQVAAGLGIEFDRRRISDRLQNIVARPCFYVEAELRKSYLHAASAWGAPALAAQPTDSKNSTAAEDFISGYDAIAERRPVHTITWRPPCFFQSEKPGMPLQEALELTGPARSIVYGPYLGLPRGAWVATPRFRVADNQSGNVITFDIVSDCGSAKGKCALPPEGVFACDIAFDVTEPRHGIEIRISISQGAIEGTLELLDVSWRRR